jgi:ribosomal protein L37AE/L43A
MLLDHIAGALRFMTLREQLKRQLACIRLVFEAGVRCPRCKAGLAEKVPSIALGFITSCPHCGLSFAEPYAG